VAGLVALIWSANPALIGQIEATEEIIRHSARPVSVSEACAIETAPGGEPSLLEELTSLDNPPACACGEASGVPNNVYGWGEIDALKAVELAQEYREKLDSQDEETHYGFTEETGSVDCRHQPGRGAAPGTALGAG
jgi:hypothetical protein